MEISLRKLAARSFRTYRIRNLAAVLAIMMTAILFTTVTTIGMGTMESLTLTMQMAKGSKADGDFRYMTAEQFGQLENAGFIESYGLRMPVGFLTNTVRHNIEFDVMDETQAELTFCNPSHGTMPQAENEVVASDAALHDLGIEPEIGAVVPAEFSVRGKTYQLELVLSGWYKASNGQISIMWAGTAFRDAHPDIFKYTYDTDTAEYYPPWEPPVSRFRAIRKWYFPPSEPPQHIVAAPIFDFTINLLIVILGELLMQCHQIIYREVFLCLRRQKSEAFWNFWEKI